MKKRKVIHLILAAPLVVLLLVALVLYDRQRAAGASGLSLDAEPISPELQAAVDDLWAVRGGALDADLKAWALTGGEPTEDQQAAIESRIAAYRALVDRPDYFLQAIGLGADAPKTLYPSAGIDAGTMARLLERESGLALERGDHERALDLAASIANSARIDRYSGGNIQASGAFVLAVAVRAWSRAIRATGDPDLLRASLDAQDALARQFGSLPPDLDRDSRDFVEIVRELQRRGVEIEIPPLHGNAILSAIYEARVRYLRDILIPRVRAAGGNTSTLDGQLFEERMQLENLEFLAVPASAIRHPIRTLETSLIRNSVQALSERARLAISVSPVQFDLLRLETAERLYTLATGAAPNSIDDLVPGFLPEALGDRFDPDGEPYRRAGVWYSIGPDEIDDGASVRYPTGRSSLGDIFLQPAPPPTPPSGPPPAS